MANEVLRLCMSKGFFLDKEVLELFSGLSTEDAGKVVDALKGFGVEERVISRKLFENYLEKLRAVLVKEKGDKMYNFLEVASGGGDGLILKTPQESSPALEETRESEGEITGKVKLISAPAFPQKKINVKDFVKHFRSRYESIKLMLEGRDFENLSSIRKIGDRKGNYTIIAAVLNKRVTKNKNLFVEVEDLTGTSVVLINQNKKEVFEKGRDLLRDDIVAFKVSGDSDMLFANDIVYPEASLSEKRYSKFDEYVAFLSDFHVGSTMFLEKNLLNFIKWLNGKMGDEDQRILAGKVKYLFLLGDNIDGVGHYPGQERYLIQKTSKGQYDKLGEILDKVRKDVRMIMCPGQHDAVWVGEPQPIIGERFAESLHKIKNLTLVPNPSLIEIDGGFRILMYHGASINRFIDEMAEIRTKFGHSSPTRVVREMLKRRHLAPVHGLMDYIPCERGDSLVISKIPDILATADQHRAEVSVFNNILMVASSCWQTITPFEEKVGNVPDPCKVPLFNLKTREIKILDFSDEPKEIKWEEGENLICKLEGK